MSGPGVWRVPEVLSPRGPGEVVAGRAQSARALRTRGPRHPCGGHVHDTVASGARGARRASAQSFPLSTLLDLTLKCEAELSSLTSFNTKKTEEEGETGLLHAF